MFYRSEVTVTTGCVVTFSYDSYDIITFLCTMTPRFVACDEVTSRDIGSPFAVRSTHRCVSLSLVCCFVISFTHIHKCTFTNASANTHTCMRNVMTARKKKYTGAEVLELLLASDEDERHHLCVMHAKCPSALFWSENVKSVITAFLHLQF